MLVRFPGLVLRGGKVINDINAFNRLLDCILVNHGSLNNVEAFFSELLKVFRFSRSICLAENPHFIALSEASPGQR